MQTWGSKLLYILYLILEMSEIPAFLREELSRWLRINIKHESESVSHSVMFECLQLHGL